MENLELSPSEILLGGKHDSMKPELKLLAATYDTLTAILVWANTIGATFVPIVELAQHPQEDEMKTECAAMVFASEGTPPEPLTATDIADAVRASVPARHEAMQEDKDQAPVNAKMRQTNA